MSIIKPEVYGQPEKHFEAILFKKQNNKVYSYLDNKLHKKRLTLISEIIREIVDKSINKKMIMINLGCGEGELENQVKSLANLYKIGIDVSLEVLQVGLDRQCFDRVISVDVEKDLDKIDKLPKADFVVAAEILEHIRTPGVFIKKVINPLIKHGGYFLGSVPNIAQIHDVIGLLTGMGESYQTTRPLTDVASGHISFFSIHSLLTTLKYAGYSDIKVMGNGVRINRNGDKNSFCLSKLPFFINFSDRFIFKCRKL